LNVSSVISPTINITLVIEIPLKTRYDNTNDAACFEKKWGKDMEYQYLVQVETLS
jgi:hypothetical protein